MLLFFKRKINKHNKYAAKHAPKSKKSSNDKNGKNIMANGFCPARERTMSIENTLKTSQGRNSAHRDL